MDIEKFPTNETAKDMMSMVSPVYEKSYVAKWLYQVMGWAMGKAKDMILGLPEETTPDTCDKTIAYWEELYSIAPNPDLSLEERRTQLITRRNFRKPMGPAKIEQIIGTETGHKITLHENVAPYTFSLEIESADKTVKFQEIIDKVNTLKPSHVSMNCIFEEVAFDVPKFLGSAMISIPRSISDIGGEE